LFFGRILQIWHELGEKMNKTFDWEFKKRSPPLNDICKYRNENLILNSEWQYSIAGM